MKTLKIASLTIAAPLLCLLTAGGFAPKAKTPVPKLSQRSVSIIRVAGLPFKDLNRNGRLDPYEDWRKSPSDR